MEPSVWSQVGGFLVFALAVWAVMVVMDAISGNEEEDYGYPFEEGGDQNAFGRTE